MNDRLSIDRSATDARARMKYRQISNQLLSEIEEGRWKPGDQLPSEEQLATRTQASLGTVQRALRELVDMGVVERHHGRGTFVSGARAPERHLRHFRFVSDFGRTLLPVYFNVIDIERTDEAGPWQMFLGPAEEGFIRIRRLVSVNREFEAFSEVYLPAKRFALLARLSPQALSGISVREFLAERFNAPTLRTRQTMLCQELPPRVSRLIDIPAGRHGMIWTICGMSYRDAPITWQRIFVPPSDRGIELCNGDPP